jgi:hypothetical protein
MAIRAATVAAILAAVVAQTASAAASTPTLGEYARAVTGICRGALLFEGRHQIGTRAGAIAVSRDIRASGSRRLRQVDAVPKPSEAAQQVVSWIAIERRLVATYASAYLQIWDKIERATTPRERSQLPNVLQALIHQPDRLQEIAGELELALGVPDCTGGRPQQAPPSGDAIR